MLPQRQPVFHTGERHPSLASWLACAFVRLRRPKAPLRAPLLPLLAPLDAGFQPAGGRRSIRRYRGVPPAVKEIFQHFLQGGGKLACSLGQRLQHVLNAFCH